MNANRGRRFAAAILEQFKGRTKVGPDPNRIGGADIATLFGISPASRGGLIGLYARLTGDSPPPEEDSLPLRRGRLLEPVIAELARSELGLQIRPGRQVDPCVRDWARASLDGEVWDEELCLWVPIELKSVSHWVMRGWTAKSHPYEHELQCQWYGLNTHTPRVHLVGFLGGDSLAHHILQADEELQGMELEVAERFMRDHVDKRVPPPPDATLAYHEWLLRKYPRTDGTWLTAGTDEERWAKVYLEARKQKRALEESEHEARHWLENRIKGADGMSGNGWRLSWYETRGRAAPDWKAIAKAAGVSKELVEVYTKQQESTRSFRMTVKGEKENGE